MSRATYVIYVKFYRDVSSPIEDGTVKSKELKVTSSLILLYLVLYLILYIIDTMILLYAPNCTISVSHRKQSREDFFNAGSVTR